MAIGQRQFKISAFLASLFFIVIFVIGITKFESVISARELVVPSIVNISADLCTMALGYILFICTVVDRSKNEDNLNYYLLMLFTCVSNAFLDEICWLVDGVSELTYLNTVTNTFYYFCAPVMAFLFWRYVITYLGVEHKSLTKVNNILVAGLIISVLAILINPPFGYYFYIKPDGFYQRGDFYLLSMVYPYVAIILTVILVFLAKKRFKRYQLVILCLYAFMPLAVGIFSIFTYGISLTSPTELLVLLLMYCVLNVIQSRERSISESELQMANSIQENMLPHIFPPYPHRSEFSLYASMTAAKEVGGDFYDFYMPDEDHLVVTIADVSGKGIPAALFMMVTKTLIKNRGLTDFEDASGILSTVNDQLCEGNELDMFVTVWIGVLNVNTGELRFANAGHEYPALKRANGQFELVKDKHSPPLGCMEGIPYREQKMQLEPGDILYIYTDGVTEANNTAKELFGEERMLKALNLAFDGTMEGLDKNIRDNIAEFMGGAEQFDDITMLSMRYNGPNKDKKEDAV